jgi:5-methylcytosine-specific restriction endonuclease McrA
MGYKDREKKNANGREWKAKNREKVLASSRRYERENADAQRERKHRSYMQNREAVIARAVQWQRDNPEKHAENKRRRRERLAQAPGSHTTADWRALCRKYDNRCLCCGNTGRIERDHIIPIIKGGSNDIENIQPLCRRCNCSKGQQTIDYRPTSAAGQPSHAHDF